MPKIFSGTITTRLRLPELRPANPEEKVDLLSCYATNLQTENDVLRIERDKYREALDKIRCLTSEQHISTVAEIALEESDDEY